MTNSKLFKSRRRSLRTRFKLKKYFCDNVLRISLFKSNKNILVQLIDDSNSCTLCAIGTNSNLFLLSHSEYLKKNRVSMNVADKLANIFANLIKEKIFKDDKNKNYKFVFDRGANKYVGIVKRFVDGLRQNDISI
ncbi:MAG: 50S ribosomal protein L18 [Anaplasmataceae bacterium]|nr:50S ribosomal protein L18 [Anaplasmataceae bacterium]